MAAFDPKAYEEKVVKPLRRRRPTDPLPDDVVTRYAIDLAMSDADVARRVAEVRSCWNKGAQAQNKPPAHLLWDPLAVPTANGHQHRIGQFSVHSSLPVLLAPIARSRRSVVDRSARIPFSR